MPTARTDLPQIRQDETRGMNMKINITWYNGSLTIYDCENEVTCGSVPHDEPITASTDSYAVATKVCEELGWALLGSVDHDGGDIFCSVEVAQEPA